MIISSRTPEGEPNRCSVCGSEIRIDPSRPAGDAPCPHCGNLLWFPNDALTVVEGFQQTDLDTLLEMVQRGDGQRMPLWIRLDFEHVTFMSSAMITKLILLHKAITVRGGRLVLGNLSPNVREVFKSTNLAMLFDTDGASAPSTMSKSLRPRFTLMRLLGSVAIVSVGCCMSALSANPGEGLVFVGVSVGSAIGAIYRGPLGSLIGAAFAWLVLAISVLLAAILASGYLIVTGG